MNFQLTNEEVKAQERNLNTTSKHQKQDSKLNLFLITNDYSYLISPNITTKTFTCISLFHLYNIHERLRLRETEWLGTTMHLIICTRILSLTAKDSHICQPSSLKILTVENLLRAFLKIGSMDLIDTVVDRTAKRFIMVLFTMIICVFFLLL